jgi:hypothetical protein
MVQFGLNASKQSRATNLATIGLLDVPRVTKEHCLSITPRQKAEPAAIRSQMDILELEVRLGIRRQPFA